MKEYKIITLFDAVQKNKKFIFFLVATSFLIFWISFEFQSEKYYYQTNLHNQKIDRVEGKILSAAYILNTNIPHNPVSLFLYEIAIKEYNSSIAEIKIVDYILFTNNEEQKSNLLKEYFGSYENILEKADYWYNGEEISFTERYEIFSIIFQTYFKQDIDLISNVASSFENEEKYDEALEEYEKILEIDKYFLPFLIKSVKILEKQENLENGNLLIERITFVLQNFNQAYKHEEGKLIIHEVIDELENQSKLTNIIFPVILTEWTFDQKVLEKYANITFENSDYATSLRTYETLLQIEPNNESYLKQFQKLSDIVKPSLKEKIGLLEQSADNFENEKKYDEALEEYEKILEMDTDYDINKKLLQINAILGNKELVSELVNQESLSEYEVAETMYLLNNYEEALKIYDKIYLKYQLEEIWEKRKITSDKLYENKNFSNNIETITKIANDFENEKKYDEALEEYEKILEMDKFSPIGIEKTLRIALIIDDMTVQEESLNLLQIIPVEEQSNYKKKVIQMLHELASQFKDNNDYEKVISIKDKILEIEKLKG